MTDTAIEPRRRADVTAESRTSVPALVTYWLLAIWTGVVVAVFVMVAREITIDGILLALVSGLIGTQTTLLVAAISFWVGATQGGKAANERLSEASKLSNAALQKAVDSRSAKTATVTEPLNADITVRAAGDDGDPPPANPPPETRT